MLEQKANILTFTFEKYSFWQIVDVETFKIKRFNYKV